MKATVTIEVDLKLLRKQKHTLFGIIVDKDKGDDNPQVDDLDGILHMIDAIQDYAVDELGFPENEVHELTNECSECGFDLGEGYSNCGASEDGTCPECGNKEGE